MELFDCPHNRGAILENIEEWLEMDEMILHKKIKQGLPKDRTQDLLFKCQMVRNILKGDVVKAQHFYQKWSDAIAEVFEDMCVNSDHYELCAGNVLTKQEVAISKSQMLDMAGKVFSVDKDLYRFLIHRMK